ncbi:hypothetical protein J3E72DRAFT_204721 [Bipolaris maydis]|nr:hypothetical protein J3E72DRAFT_204721 [Bipolaris maydis]
MFGRALPDGGIELHRQTASKTCVFWDEFPPFVPNRTKPFKEEFGRLANQEGWGKKTKREYLVKALNAEIDFHSDKTSGLVRWQRLCQELGLSNEPKSKTQCKRILKSRFVNLYTLLDHRRNPDVPVVCFNSCKELLHDIRRTGNFPRECAKHDGYMKIFLQRL